MISYWILWTLFSIVGAEDEQLNFGLVVPLFITTIWKYGVTDAFRIVLTVLISTVWLVRLK
jgi:hypothetical protein